MRQGGKAEPSQLGWSELSNQGRVQNIVWRRLKGGKSGRGIVEQAALPRAGRMKQETARRDKLRKA